MYTSLDMPLHDMIRGGSNSNWGRGKARVRGRGRGGLSRGRPIQMSHRGPLRVNTRPSPSMIAKSFSRAKDLITRHDLFKESMASAGLLGLESGLKLYISNLDSGVSSEDIKDLFSEVGKLKRCTVHYDRNGQPSGSAEVHFVRKSDAMAALTRYNNVLLDGKAMKIEIVGTNSALPDVPHVNSIGGPYGCGNRMAMNSNIRASKFGQGRFGSLGRMPGSNIRASKFGRGGLGSSGHMPSSNIRPSKFGQGRFGSLGRMPGSNIRASKFGRGGLGSSGRMPGGNRGGFQRVRGRGRSIGQGRGFGRGRGRGRFQSRVKSADELDKELETYHAMST